MRAERSLDNGAAIAVESPNITGNVGVEASRGSLGGERRGELGKEGGIFMNHVQDYYSAIKMTCFPCLFLNFPWFGRQANS